MAISGISSMSMNSIQGIGPMMRRPQVKNDNELSVGSLNKVAAISDDVTDSKVDFSGLLDEAVKTINPLKRGESVNYADILASQMAMSTANRTRLMIEE